MKGAVMVVLAGWLCGVAGGQVESLRDIGVEHAAAAPSVGGEDWASLVSQSGVLLRVQCRVCFRSVQVLDTPQGRVERVRTGYYVLARQVYKGPVQVGDYLYFETEEERATDAPLFLSVNHTPQPFCECILQARAAEFFAPGCARLQGVWMMEGREDLD